MKVRRWQLIEYELVEDARVELHLLGGEYERVKRLVDALGVPNLKIGDPNDAIRITYDFHVFYANVLRSMDALLELMADPAVVVSADVTETYFERFVTRIRSLQAAIDLA